MVIYQLLFSLNSLTFLYILFLDNLQYLCLKFIKFDIV